MGQGRDLSHAASVARREVTLELVQQGFGVLEALADPRVGVSHAAYRQWRANYPSFAAAIDVARATMYRPGGPNKLTDLTSAQFAFRYFRRIRAPFQQRWIDTVRGMRQGDILLALWPPEYGKTTTLEDFATEEVCRNNEWRSTVVSENDTISKKIIGTVKRRLEAGGPTPQLVADWGPFRQTGGDQARSGQAWNNEYFNIMQKRSSDQRDHTMMAIGWKSSSVSIRTDLLAIDDITSRKTLRLSPEMLKVFRQDLLSRPGETGRTIVNGTRVDDGDFYEGLLEDDELIDSGILHVLRFPAIVFDEAGNPSPLWPDRHSLENLERIRIKIKDQAFDRNYMMQPGRSDKTKRAFGEEGWGRAKLPNRTLNEEIAWDGQGAKEIGVISLDPGLSPGINCLGGWAMTAESMRLVYFAEADDFSRNEQIIASIGAACRHMADGMALRHLTVESKGFQRGLARDERLESILKHFGITGSEHDTGMNKYDETIGIASMAADWRAGKIQLPYNDEDPTTVAEMDELFRQFKKWKPDPRTGLMATGNKVRYDRLMMTWFAWIWWVNNRHRLGRNITPITRSTMPYKPTRMGSIIPVGARFS